MQPPTKREWSDEMCLAEGQKYCLWKEIPTNEMKGHLISFVNLWFSPDSTEDKKICSKIRNVLLMMPLGMSNELLLADVFDSARETAQAPSAVDDKDSIIKDPDVDHLDHKEYVKVLALHTWLKQNFTQLTILEPNCPEYQIIFQKLRIVLGFCALTLIQMITKNELRTKRYFPYGATKTFDRLFSEVGLNVSLVAPASELFKSALLHLRKNSCSTESVELLHLLVFQYLKSVAKDDQSSRLAREILEEGCLKVIEGNGMGLVTMFQDVKLIYPNIEERQLLSMIATHKDDAKSLERLIKFLDTYAQPDKPNYSWKWSRILFQSYFSDMNIRGNLNLCAKFAALLLDKNPNIFGHHELKNKTSLRDSAIKWAESIKKQLKDLNDDLQQDY